MTSISATLGAMRKRPTFDELVGVISRDDVKIKLPDRTALRVEQWVQEPRGEVIACLLSTSDGADAEES